MEEQSCLRDLRYGKVKNTGIFKEHILLYFFSLAGVKNDDYEGAIKLIEFEISDIYRRIKHNLDLEKLSEDDRNIIENMSTGIDEYKALTAIKMLSGILSRYYGKKVILLLDEYDTPMIEAYFSGYCDKMIKFMRTFLITL